MDSCFHHHRSWLECFFAVCASLVLAIHRSIYCVMPYAWFAANKFNLNLMLELRRLRFRLRSCVCVCVWSLLVYSLFIYYMALAHSVDLCSSRSLDYIDVALSVRLRFAYALANDSRRSNSKRTRCQLLLRVSSAMWIFIAIGRDHEHNIFTIDWYGPVPSEWESCVCRYLH